MYGPEMFAFFVLCVVLFIGEVFYKEAFSDCSSPGALTWTITMNPGSGGSTCSSSSESSESSEKSETTETTDKSDDTDDTDEGVFDLKNNVDKYYGHSHHVHHKLGRSYDDDYYGYSAQSIEKLWRDISGSDISGTDISGNLLGLKYNFNLSLTDLLSLVGKTILYGDSRKKLYNNSYDLPDFYNNSVESRYERALAKRKYELQKYPYYYNDYEEYFQNRNSPSNAQAVDYIQRKNQINMDDYVRKDSIPCYGCTLP